MPGLSEWRRSPGRKCPRVTRKERHASHFGGDQFGIAIDQISAVRLKTGWKIIEPGTFEVSWSRDKGLMYYLWAIVVTVTGTTNSTD